MDRLLDAYAQALPTRPKLRGTGLPSPKHVQEEVTRVRASAETMGAGGRPVAELAAADVRRMLDASSGSPAVARARFGALSRFLDWCQEGQHLVVNPCALVAKARRPRAVQARAHFLSIPDLAKLWQAADALPHAVWRDLARFLIAVPCRRGEAAAMDWAHLALDEAEWRQLGYMTKNGEAHRFHLHPLALDLLQRRWTDAGKPRTGLVFPSPGAGRVVQTFSHLKLNLDETAELTGWRWHDFRRSFATALAENGTPEAIADAVLNHKQSATRGGVLGVYQRSNRWPEQVDAMRAWGELLAEALEARPKREAGNVVAIGSKRRRAA